MFELHASWRLRCTSGDRDGTWIYVHKLMYNCSHLYNENLGLWIVCVKQQFE